MLVEQSYQIVQLGDIGPDVQEKEKNSQNVNPLKALGKVTDDQHDWSRACNLLAAQFPLCLGELVASVFNNIYFKRILTHIFVAK